MLTRRQRKVLAGLERAERQGLNWTAYLCVSLAPMFSLQRVKANRIRAVLQLLADRGFVVRSEKAMGIYGFRWKLTEQGRQIVLEDRPKNGGQSLST